MCCCAHLISVRGERFPAASGVSDGGVTWCYRYRGSWRARFIGWWRRHESLIKVLDRQYVRTRVVYSGARVDPNRHFLLVVLADTAACDGDDDHDGHQGPRRHPQVQPAVVLVGGRFFCGRGAAEVPMWPAAAVLAVYVGPEFVYKSVNVLFVDELRTLVTPLGRRHHCHFT